MPLLSLRNVTLSHGGLPLFTDGNLTIEPGDHVCLIGRNGAGKSSLLQLLQGKMTPEKGTVECDSALTVAMLEQKIPKGYTQTVYEIVEAALTERGVEEWERQYRVDIVLQQLKLDPNQNYKNLSGGLKRRVLLARGLVVEPDVLLLDEPTNHLDIESIQWLEKFLKTSRQTFVMVTHDRELMQQVCDHIVEIDNGRVHSWRGHYQDYLDHKDIILRAEAKANALFDKRLAEEEVWIRQGIKARRTRNEGRVRALEKMRVERSQRRSRPGEVKIAQQAAAQSGKVVFEVENLHYGYGDKVIIDDFSTVILRGDKVGLIGANGSGKSTFLQLLLDQLQPKSGTIKCGTQLEVAYFDQQQAELDDNMLVYDNVAGGSDSVTVGGKTKHVMSYLQDFLFSPERARSPLRALSGGERNRVMLAKLFLKPCNLLILDEPTNDLDVETLELLEEKLTEYSGTLLLVSHDRRFLNNIVTSTIVFSGDGVVDEYVGGYDDWIRQQKPPVKKVVAPKTVETKKVEAPPKNDARIKRDLEQATRKIATLESKQKELHEQLADSTLYVSNPDKVQTLQKSLLDVETELTKAYARWEELESQL